MPFNKVISLPKPIALPSVDGARRWWHRLTPHRQDRVAMLAPLAAVLLFFAAIVSALGYLRVEEMDREQEAVQRDVEYTQQRLRLRLLERQEQIMRIAREISNRELDLDDFRQRAAAMLDQYPEVQGMAWVDDKQRTRSSLGMGGNFAGSLQSSTDVLSYGAREAGYTLTREVNQPLYIQPPRAKDEAPMLQMFVPLSERGRFSGVLLTEYSVDGLYRYGVPSEVSARYAVSLQDANGRLLAGTSIPDRKLVGRVMPWSNPANEYAMPVSPVGSGLVIRAQAYRASLGVIGSGLFWLVSALSVMTAWMLIANWRHTRRRVQAQQALMSETNFRRAMENSMLTGMRAMDLQGRITYVNAAFCQMTGWSESDLVGRTAPFPYWPDSDRDNLASRLEEEMHGNTTPGGIQVRVKRRDNTLFDARLYVSPLIDAMGTQTGWVTSMTDITEPNRVREQLSASHQRFTTVLEALDASISVAPLGSDELLFANKLYRQWFGVQAGGHLQLVAEAGVPVNPTNDEASDSVDSFAGLPTTALPDSDSESAEIFITTLGKWLEVRTRYLSWVDGRLAQMVIATDITTRRLAEEQAAIQAERAQTSSRLITMGEMASSVAHELNQPLTAINNYCNGMVSRIKDKQISEEDLLGALEKTAKQAQRAGQIIQRIRSFVKRSEPNRTPSEVSTMVAEAVELAEIELRRFNVRLNHYVAARLPPVMVDPILIEQVLVNLLRNAAESIDSALRQTADRIVELRVLPRHIDNKPVIEFSVQDTGKGLAPEVMARLYEAFYSTKADGMGIGLSLCRSIVESHLGRMTAENIYNGTEVSGCRFSFWVPLTEGGALSYAAPPAPQPNLG
ncbi:MAG: PAS domain-containing sensor histidine kinase [Curvibacter sp. RIFCSPHIGHO2_12_FULL_63_18]|uniref:PAS domain-containing sensor histidine kinase n=1 Tax=Rhodoferax sp. TaxID=50421 RepID=UPI0008ABF79B|nr:PAS domain S-box protein [Rhodoferax sp.]OGO96635.1 MAG: PAS domain-containing sensor histidine kinase [Curvibacter sp. GWA2_63_95]OGO98519.1 MAG: PAS domain-containing sensor histidine kinase [Curvibacter sp. RIFCSPHIGHO2_12_FULL_63_18]